MTQCFRSAVCSKVLSTAGSQHILSVTLKILYERHAQTGCQIRIFTVGLMASAPSRVTEYIDVRAPKGQTLIDIPVAFLGRSVIFCTGFGCNDLCGFS